MREDGTVADLANLEYEFMIYRMKDKNRGKVKIPSKGMVSQTLVLLQNLKPFMTYRNIHKEGRLSPICFG